MHKATLRTSCGENKRMQSKKQAPGSDQESQEGRVRHADQRKISSHCHGDTGAQRYIRGELETIADPLSKISSTDLGIKWKFLRRIHSSL